LHWVRNRGVAKETLMKDGMTLQWASEEMKGDRELCIAAVAQNGFALEHASNSMQQDEALVKEAVRQLRTWKSEDDILRLLDTSKEMVRSALKGTATDKNA